MPLTGKAKIDYQRGYMQQRRGSNKNEVGSNNVAWKCRRCGEVTYHPRADRDAKIEIRETTLCLKCLRERR